MVDRLVSEEDMVVKVLDTGWSVVRVAMYVPERVSCLLSLDLVGDFLVPSSSILAPL